MSYQSNTNPLRTMVITVGLIGAAACSVAIAHAKLAAPIARHASIKLIDENEEERKASASRFAFFGGLSLCFAVAGLRMSKH